MSRFSIILITHNNAEHIVAGIDSILKQTDDRWACYLVDNGSSDTTVAVAKAKAGHDARFSVYLKPNEGPSSGRNFGFRQLPPDTEYVHFLDGDDCLRPDFLKIMGNYLDAHANVGLLGCQFDIIDSAGRELGPGYRSRFAPGWHGWPRFLRDDEYRTPFATFFSATGQGPFAMFRRSILQKTKLYDERMWSHEDSDIFCQMALQAQVHYLPDRLYRKRVHDHNLTGSSRANYALFRDKWDNYQPKNDAESKCLKEALNYYYYRHRPLRDFKIGFKAIGEFIRRPTLQSVKWAVSRFKSGLKGLFCGKEAAATGI